MDWGPWIGGHGPEYHKEPFYGPSGVVLHRVVPPAILPQQCELNRHKSRKDSISSPHINTHLDNLLIKESSPFGSDIII